MKLLLVHFVSGRGTDAFHLLECEDDASEEDVEGQIDEIVNADYSACDSLRIDRIKVQDKDEADRTKACYYASSWVQRAASNLKHIDGDRNQQRMAMQMAGEACLIAIRHINDYLGEEMQVKERNARMAKAFPPGFASTIRSLLKYVEEAEGKGEGER